MVTAGLEMLNNRFNKFDDNKISQVTNIIETILGIADHKNMILTRGNGVNNKDVALAEVLGNKPLNHKNTINIIGIIKQNKPELLIKLVNNEQFTKRKFLGLPNFISNTIVNLTIKKAIKQMLK